MSKDQAVLERTILERELKELQQEQLNHNLPARIKLHIEREIDRVQKLLILNKLKLELWQRI